jgi:hypothetical protein
MEISVREEQERAANIPFLQHLTTQYDLFKYGGWPGPDRLSEWQSDDPKLVDHILDKAAAEIALQLNLWWKPKETTTHITSKV